MDFKSDEESSSDDDTNWKRKPTKAKSIEFELPASLELESSASLEVEGNVEKDATSINNGESVEKNNSSGNANKINTIPILNRDVTKIKPNKKPFKKIVFNSNSSALSSSSSSQYNYTSSTYDVSQPPPSVYDTSQPPPPLTTAYSVAPPSSQVQYNVSVLPPAIPYSTTSSVSTNSDYYQSNSSTLYQPSSSYYTTPPPSVSQYSYPPPSMTTPVNFFTVPPPTVSAKTSIDDGLSQSSSSRKYSRSRSRSRSPKRHRKSKSPSRSYRQSKYESKRYDELDPALYALKKVHESDCEEYYSNPSSHPDYQDEQVLFVESFLKKKVTEGITPSSAEISSEWKIFWKYKLDYLLEKTWEKKKELCISLMKGDARKKRSPSKERYRSRSRSNSREKSRAVSSNKDKYRSRSRSVEKYNDKNKSNNRNMSSIGEKYIIQTRSGSRERYRNRSSSRERYRNRSGSRERYRNRSGSRDRYRNRSGSRERYRNRSGSRERYRNRSSSKERYRNRSKEIHRNQRSRSRSLSQDRERYSKRHSPNSSRYKESSSYPLGIEDLEEIEANAQQIVSRSCSNEAVEMTLDLDFEFVFNLMKNLLEMPDVLQYLIDPLTLFNDAIKSAKAQNKSLLKFFDDSHKMLFSMVNKMLSSKVNTIHKRHYYDDPEKLAKKLHFASCLKDVIKLVNEMEKAIEYKAKESEPERDYSPCDRESPTSLTSYSNEKKESENTGNRDSNVFSASSSNTSKSFVSKDENNIVDLITKFYKKEKVSVDESGSNDFNRSYRENVDLTYKDPVIENENSYDELGGRVDKEVKNISDDPPNYQLLEHLAKLSHPNALNKETLSRLLSELNK